MRTNFLARTAIVLALFPIPGRSARLLDMMAVPLAAQEQRRQGCDRVEDYMLGTSIQAEFTAADCSLLDAGQREPVDVWRIHTDSRRDLHVVVEAPGMDVRLRLLTDDGLEIEADEYVGPFTQFVTQVPAGTYRLEVRSRGAASGGRAYGRYVLRSSTDQLGFEGCPVLTPLPAPGSVRGEWSVEDCVQPAMMRLEMRHHDYYLLEVHARRDVSLALEAPGINGTIALFTREGAPLDEAMAIGGPGRITAQLAPGQYVVRVGVGLEPGRETGPYTLSVR